MANIRFVYFAMLTRSGSDSGTDSAINLIISEGGVDRLNHRFSDTSQEDQERGQANLYRLDVRSAGIESRRLLDGSIRVGILGDDEWRPELLFVWGDATPVSVSPAIVPLAIETGITERLSTNDEGAVASIPLRRVRMADATTPIQRLILILVTAFDPDPDFGEGSFGDPGPSGKGTNDPVELQVVAGGNLVVKHVLPDTPQEDLESGQANLYTIPVAVPFTRASMGPDAVRLMIGGTDLWLPKSIYLFGLNSAGGQPSSMIPLVHVDNWRTVLSTDAREGRPDVVLPLLPRPVTSPPDNVATR